MKVAQTAKPLIVIHATNTGNRKDFSKKTPKASTDYKRNTSGGTVIQQASRQADVLAVHCKAVDSGRSQFSRDTTLSESFSQRVQEWQERVKVSEKFTQYRNAFIDMPSEIQAIWDRHPRTINVPKDRTELLHDNVRPLQST